MADTRTILVWYCVRWDGHIAVRASRPDDPRILKHKKVAENTTQQPFWSQQPQQTPYRPQVEVVREETTQTVVPQ